MTMHEQTTKALRYLHARDVVTAPAEGPLWGYSFIAGGASEKMQQHVARVYPLAAVRFVDRLQVIEARLEMDIAFSLAVAGIDQAPAAGMAAAIMRGEVVA